ncbi:hypothetical protein TSAR_002729 [Trichomalopsis sarcophagae]|uniref:G-protein coupled receptors family 1 profile domain-containing protein n=1 Tax=Trichomalopsis sarcophagae TaxID=543379 RepID=A0A232F9B6_9HYME|nr:hypothetical protein TSAR_002729 [Trichomalopsis sarcophagae]
MQLSSHESTAIPHQQLRDVMRILNGYENETEDFSQPQLKKYFADSYLLFVFIYSLLIVSSTVANFAMVFHIIKYDMHKDPTCAFLINVVIANVIHVLFVLPFTLAVLLMRNWIFGQFFCYCLPILQDIPIHVSMMTYLLIAGDRYRLLNDPRKPRIPAFVCALGTWFFAVCIALPHPIYTTYLDLPSFGDTEQGKRIHRGLQMCMSNLADDIQEYIRSLFIGTYIAPLTITAYLYVKSGQELQRQEGPLAVAVFESRAKDSASYSRQGSNTSNEIALSIHRKRGSESVGTSATAAFSNLSASYDLDDAELDVQKEKRTQKYLIFMVTAYAVCLCPLMVLRLARSAFQETYDNSSHIDMTFVLFIWVAFLPALITPCLYASWQMSR